MDRWRGKVAVVTGAASGIGAAVTQRLLDAGLIVLGLDLQYELLLEQQAKQRQRSDSSSGNLHVLRCDVSREEDLVRAFDWVDENLGALHVLVNNAGVINYTPVIESDRATFEKLLNINVIAMASCIRKAVRSMRANKVEGHIINVNSILGHVIPEGANSELEGANGWNLYPTSKHATVALTHTVRREICRAGLPIRITSISPGLVKTGIANHAKPVQDLLENGPTLDPNDIADALMYALSTRPEVQISEITVRRTGEVV